MNGSLPDWIQRLLGIETVAGEGTVWRVEHSWNWMPWVTLLLLVLAVGFVAGMYARESRAAGRLWKTVLATIRLSLVAIVLVMIAQFTLSLERTGLPYVAVLVDDSLSMSIVDRYEEKLGKRLEKQVKKAGFDELSRMNLAKTILSERGGGLLEGIAGKYKRDYKLRVYFLTEMRPHAADDMATLSEHIRSARPVGKTTRLGAAVRTILDDLRGTVPAGIVILSDGINTDGPALDVAATLARRKAVPLFTVALGDDRPATDLKLTDLLVDEVVFVDDVVDFQCKLTATGFEGREARVVLRHKDKPRVLAETTIKILSDGRPRQVRLPYRPGEIGEFRYVVEVEPLDGELQTDNNRLERTVRVTDEQIRVLLVQAYPNFEFRYLRNMLARDGTIRLHTVLQDADPEHAGQDAAALGGFPVRRDELFGYDVIILGDVDPKRLGDAALQHLADFVNRPDKGGALVFLAGPKSMPLAYRDTPLARLMPIRIDSARLPVADRAITEGFVVQPTELGLVSPSMQLGDTPAETQKIWENLPPLYWMLEAPEPKPAARVLAVHPTRLGHDGRPLPVICTQYVGAGKVLMHMTDETWRWRWRTGDTYFARYWVQTIRALSRAKLSGGDRSAVLSADRREYRRGEPARLRVRFADPRLAPAEDDGVIVVLEHPGHQNRRIPLRRAGAREIFESVLLEPALGSYHAWVAVPTLEGRAPAVDFTVVAPPGEFEHVRTDTASLRRAAERTQGRFYTPLVAGRLLGDLPPGRQVPVESLPPVPLWNKWPLLLIFLILLVGEWVLRKSKGMV